MKKIYSVFLTMWMVVFAVTSDAQEVTQSDIPLDAVKTINFKERADYEAAHPLLKHRRFIEQGEDREEEFEFIPKPVPSDVVPGDVPQTQHQHRAGTNSPAPSVSFNGSLDNGTLIPPDIRGGAGPNHVMETTNQEFKIYSKTGVLISNVSISTFFAASGGSRYFDPHILYDPTNSRWLICIAGNHSSGYGGIFLAVSQTTDPTANWYIYSFAGISNTADFLDYPLVGYNTNWLVVTGNDFLSSGLVTGKIYVMNRASLYAGTLGSVTAFTDANAFTLAPAQTFDVTQTTLYMVANWNGNSNGSGYVRIGRITGTPNAPIYSTGSLLGVTQPWSNSSLDAPQAGTTNRIDAGDSRVGNAVYRNGSLWFCQTAFLPASSPTRSAVQWWQVNPAVPSLQQFGRVDGGSPTGVFYSYASIAVNNNGDVLLGHCQSSTTSYASASYSVRAVGDPANTLQNPYIYKTGIGSYYKTFGGGRNRWGDYTGAGVDPSNNSFWNFNQWANSGNKWGTVIANVAVPAALPCSLATGLTTSGIGNNTATFSWTAVSGASSYTLLYHLVGTSTWSVVNTTGTSYTVSGLSPGTNYEWMVQTVCSNGGTSGYTSVVPFTTTGSIPCTTPTFLVTTSITSTSATFSWAAVTGAVSYNIQYRIVGSSTWTTATTSATSYSVSGLTAGTNYEWQVRTVCSGNTSSYSTSITFTTTTVSSCTGTNTWWVSNIATTTGTLNWSSATGAVSYNVRYRPVGAVQWISANCIPNYYQMTGLVPGTAYEWQLQTVCSTGVSSYTSPDNFFTANTTSCSIPTGLGASSVTNNSASLTWHIGGGATGHNIRYRPVTSSTWSTGVAMSGYNVFFATGLQQATEYVWQIQTVCANGVSAYITAPTFITTGSGCTVPGGLTTTNITDTSASLSWTPVSGATGYYYRGRVYGSTNWNYYYTTSAISNNPPYITPGTRYLWNVQAVCPAGRSSFSTSYLFTTTGPTGCGLPEPLTTSFITSTTALFQWSAVPGVVIYNVGYRVAGSPSWVETTSYTNVFNATGLIPNTDYEWWVLAICSTSASGYLPSLIFTTASLPSCSDNFESNNTSGTAFQATMNSRFTGLISSSADVDWFKFTTTSPFTNLEADLSNLPADYDMQLYASNATTLLATSQNRGTVSEQIKQPSASATTYYLKVYSYNGSSASLCYNLQLAASSLAYSPLPSPGDIRSDISDTIEMERAMKVYPNPTSGELQIEFISSSGGKTNLNVYNVEGQKMLNATVIAMEGLNKQTINTISLANGTYIFEVENNGELQCQRFDIAK